MYTSNSRRDPRQALLALGVIGIAVLVAVFIFVAMRDDSPAAAAETVAAPTATPIATTPPIPTPAPALQVAAEDGVGATAPAPVALADDGSEPVAATVSDTVSDAASDDAATQTTSAPQPTSAPEPTIAAAVTTAVPVVESTTVATATAAPTATPTLVATAIPTAIATAIPTAVPTAIPTAAPTAIPTATPTAIPTAEPTATATPTPTPTVEVVADLQPAVSAFTHVVTVQPQLQIIEIYDAPDGTTIMPTWQGNSLPVTNPNSLGLPRTLRVVEGQPTDAWVRVQFVGSPNGSTGWVQNEGLTWSTSNSLVQLELSTSTIAVFDGGQLVASGPLRHGRADSPTTTGDGWIEFVIDVTASQSIASFGMIADFDIAGGRVPMLGLRENHSGLVGPLTSQGGVFASPEIFELVRQLPIGTRVHIRN